MWLRIAFIVLLSQFAFSQSDNPELDRAMMGDAAAQMRLAKAYQFGEGQRKDIQEAVRWYRAAAAKGNAEAAYTLGTLAYNGQMLGDSVQQDDIAAWVWFRIAADQGYSDAAAAVTRTEQDLSSAKIMQAHEALTATYLRGGAIPANPERAAQELNWLVEHDSRQGTLLLGQMYREGHGVAKDLDKAKSFCSKAEKLRTVGGAYCLAQIASENGNEKEAFELTQKDAGYGNPEAILSLIDRLHDGKGTTANPVMSLAWATAADRVGVPGAAEKVKSIGDELSEKQRKDAAKKALAVPLGGLRQK